MENMVNIPLFRSIILDRLALAFTTKTSLQAYSGTVLQAWLQATIIKVQQGKIFISQPL